MRPKRANDVPRDRRLAAAHGAARNGVVMWDNVVDQDAVSRRSVTRSFKDAISPYFG